MTRTNHSTDESGSVLILVLVFVVAFGIVVSAILNFSENGFVSSDKLTDLGNYQHAVDGAMDAAITSIRQDADRGLVGTDALCGPYVSAPATGSSDPKVTVTCTPEAFGGGPSGDPDQPPFAVIITGTGTNEGLTNDKNNDFTVNGGIFSQGMVDIKSGLMRVIGGMYTRIGGCSTKIIVVGQKNCPFSGSHPVDTLSYPNALGFQKSVNTTAALPTTIDPPPTCVSGNKVAKFFPGLYSDRPLDLLNRTTTAAACKTAKFWWFSPDPAGGLGIYYFDFTDANPLWSLTADGVDVIGGTPKNWSPSSSSPLPDFSSSINWCDSSADGVQFNFGGAAQMIAKDANIEVCTSAAPSSVTSQQIVVYGVDADGTGSVARTTSGTPTVLTDTAPASAEFLVPAAATAIDGTSATALLHGTNGSPAVGNVLFTPFSTIPAGSTVTKVVMRVADSESQTGQTTPSVNLTFGSGTPSVTKTLSASTTLTTNSITLYDSAVSGTQDLPSAFTYMDINSMSAMYSVSTKNDIAASLDGLMFDVTYTTPGWEKLRCPTAPSVGDPPTCALIDSQTGAKPSTFFHGTFYSPSARLNLNVHNPNSGDVVFDRGVIARHIDLSVSASSDQLAGLFTLPGQTTKRQVLFTAYVNKSDRTQSCSAADITSGTCEPRLRARVQYVDSPSTGSGVTVKDWAVLK